MFEWWEYAPGKVRGRRADGGGGSTRRATTPSRFYARAKTMETVKALRATYDGVVFYVRARDAEGRVIEGGGEETRACVEFAPSQWTPREFGARYAAPGETTNAENALEGTIEEDEDYLKFLDALEAKKKANGATPRAAAPKNAESAPRKSTALLEFLWRRRAAEQREKGSGKKSSKKSSKKTGKASASKTGAKTDADADAPKTESRKKKKKPKSQPAVAPNGRASESKKTPEIKIINRASTSKLAPKAIS
jgi:regulator of nonsense transcripts 3